MMESNVAAPGFRKKLLGPGAGGRENPDRDPFPVEIVLSFFAELAS